MQLSDKLPLPKAGSGLLSTRRGNVILAAGVAVLAAILLAAYLHNYKADLTDATPVKAVVADRLIPKGASADVLTSSGELKVADVAQNRLDAGAVASIGALQGQVATRDIYPGDQITAGDFETSAQPLLTKVQGGDRAMSVSVDSSHGLLGAVRPGDHVDVLASFNGQNAGGATTQPVARVLMRDVLVLAAPASAKAKGVGAAQDAEQDVTLRVNAAQATSLAYANDNGKVWFTLRPKAGAKDPKGVDRVTLDRVLAGSAPIVIHGKAHKDGSFEITAKQGKSR